MFFFYVEGISTIFLINVLISMKLRMTWARDFYKCRFRQPTVCILCCFLSKAIHTGFVPITFNWDLSLPNNFFIIFSVSNTITLDFLMFFFLVRIHVCQLIYFTCMLYCFFCFILSCFQSMLHVCCMLFNKYSILDHIRKSRLNVQDIEIDCALHHMTSSFWDQILQFKFRD